MNKNSNESQALQGELSEDASMSRRNFIKAALAAAGVVSLTTLAGCSIDNGGVKDETLARGPAWSEYNLETYCEGYKEDKEAGTLKDEYTAIKDGDVYRIYSYQGEYYATFIEHTQE